MRNATILAMILIVSGPVLAQQGRKLPQGAYLKTAKIEMSYAEASQDMARYENAMAMLDSLFAHYGPIPEGLSLMSRIMGVFMEHATGPVEKAPWVTKFVIFADSLKWACNSPVVKEMDKKDCRDLTAFADSMRVAYWREFYNSGLGQLKAINELDGRLTGATSASETANEIQMGIAAHVDSAAAIFHLCVELDPADRLAPAALVELNQRLK